MDRKKIMEIVHKMCNFHSHSCRGLDMIEMGMELIHTCGGPQVCEIGEIPVSDKEQVVILFNVPKGKLYYSLFAGIGLDGKFYAEFSIDGAFPGTDRFRFLEPAIIMPYFNDRYEPIATIEAAVWEPYSNDIGILNSLHDSLRGVKFKESTDYFNYQWVASIEAGDIILCVLRSMGLEYKYNYALRKEGNDEAS